MADQVDDKGAPRGVTDSFVGEQVAAIEEFAGMLTVERRDELATLEVGKREVRLTKYPGISLFEQRGGRGPIRFGNSDIGRAV
jgi:hypothetical protein